MSELSPANFRTASVSKETPCLLGSRCGHCGNVAFPKMPVCPACGAADLIEEAEIGRTARLYSHTIAYVAPKGFAAPLFQVFVDLPEGPRIFALVGAKCPVGPGILTDGMELRLVVEPLTEGSERLAYKYVPAEAPQPGRTS